MSQHAYKVCWLFYYIYGDGYIKEAGKKDVANE